MPAAKLHNGTTLQQLLHGIAAAPAIGLRNIATDSRNLQAGDVFLATAGARTHGVAFASKAIAAGVAAIVYDADTAEAPEIASNTPLVPVPGLAARIGEIADRWYRAPSASLAVTGVTGTNGKTTTSLLLAQCSSLLQQRCGYLGTLGKGIDALERGTGLTTPSCVQVHETLAAFRDAGATRAVIEVSSHALQQRRVDAVRFESALFTNLSRDHIDYHGDMDRYFAAKLKLFTDHGPLRAVVSVDDRYGKMLAASLGDNVTAVSLQPGEGKTLSQFVHATSIAPRDQATQVAIDSSWGEGRFVLPLVGDFNVANALLVLAELLRRDVPMADACAVLEAVQAPPGRMQRVAADSITALPSVYVDYAHTPAGLEVALTALRAHGTGRLWCVFGCGGNRDRGKRPQMGQVVGRLADVAVLTNDNPRNEDPAAIIADVVAGMDRHAVVIEDRSAAIAYAIGNAADDDTILIAGKGHEEVQLRGDERLPFSDYQVALANLEARAAAPEVAT
jgi:UDP-N-acetylmuramoyl-L-alanyl-D-glutamate--2,6-diaminopimelate ligase